MSTSQKIASSPKIAFLEDFITIRHRLAWIKSTTLDILNGFKIISELAKETFQTKDMKKPNQTPQGTPNDRMKI